MTQNRKWNFLIEIVLFLAIILVKLRLANGEYCLKTSSCSCIGLGYEINLSYLLLTSSAVPRFKDVTSLAAPDVSFSYNPCNGFIQGDDTGPGSCAKLGTAVCMTNGTHHFSLGTQDSTQFIFNATTQSNEIHYDTNDEFKRFTYLALKCEPTLKAEDSRLSVDNVIFTSANETLFYMNLISSCACPNGCLFDQAADNTGLSFGSVLVLLFCFVVLAYLCGGIAFMHFVRGATGWELVPHFDFWVDLPLLVRDGFMFTLNGCKSAINYNRI